MRIAIVNNHMSYALGGSEVQSDIIARGLLKRGHEIAYIVPGGADADGVYNAPYNVVACTRGSIGDTIIKYRPHIVYWRFYLSRFRQALRKVRHNNIPLIYVVCNRDILYPWKLDSRYRNPAVRVLKMIRDRWQYGGIKHADMVMTINRELSGRVQGVFVPLAMEPYYEEFAWPRPYCIWVSNLRETKRPEKYIELAGRLEGSGIDFLMAGRLADKKYEWILRGEKCPDNFHYLGGRRFEEISGMMRESLFHVHTCRPEGFGNVFVQAWMQRKPSISLEFDPGNYIGDKGIGYCADGYMDKFIMDVKRLIDNADMRLEMGKRAKEFADDIFNADKVLEQIESLMEMLVKEKRAGRKIPPALIK